MPYKVLQPGEAAGVGEDCCALAVMAKAPRPGKVKTRLSPPLTPEQASALNICFIRDTTENIQQVTEASNSAGLVAYTPVGDEALSMACCPPVSSFCRSEATVSESAFFMLARIYSPAGFSAVCLIDSDSPTMPQDALLQAVERLSRAGDRMVLGGSDDGGYYLIGVKRLHPGCLSRSTGAQSACLRRRWSGRRKSACKPNCCPPGTTWTTRPLSRGCGGNSLLRRAAGYDAKHTRVLSPEPAASTASLHREQRMLTRG